MRFTACCGSGGGRTLEHGLCEGQAGGEHVGGGLDVHVCDFIMR